MKHREGRFEGVGGLSLYYQQWLPDEKPLAVIVLVHGVGEHSGRYMQVVKPIVAAGYAVCSYDHRGHGRSEGTRVYIDSWEQYRDDLGSYLDLVAKQFPGLPRVLYGHSMGSLVVLDYTIARPEGLAGLIVSGTAIEPGVGGPVLDTIAKVAGRLAPKLSVDLKIGSEALSRDPAAVAEAAADPLMTSRATARWGAESQKTVARINEHMGEIGLPLLVLHGEADTVCRVKGSQALVEAAASEDKTLQVYPGGFHEVHNDLEHEQVAKDIVAWLGRVIAPAVSV